MNVAPALTVQTGAEKGTNSPLHAGRSFRRAFPSDLSKLNSPDSRRVAPEPSSPMRGVDDSVTDATGITAGTVTHTVAPVDVTSPSVLTVPSDMVRCGHSWFGILVAFSMTVLFGHQMACMELVTSSVSPVAPCVGSPQALHDPIASLRHALRFRNGENVRAVIVARQKSMSVRARAAALYSRYKSTTSTIGVDGDIVEVARSIVHACITPVRPLGSCR